MKFVLLVTFVILGLSSLTLSNTKSLGKDLTLNFDKNSAQGSNNITIKKGQKLNMVFKSGNDGNWDIVSPKALKHVKLEKIGMAMSGSDPSNMKVEKTFPVSAQNPGTDKIHVVFKSKNKKTKPIDVYVNVEVAK